MALEVVDNFERLVIEKTPLIDLRAPIEFTKGAFSTAHNLPLMDDKEREAVGICYKQEGNQSAIKLGHQLVSGNTKEARIRAWCHFIDLYPNAVLYCFRGGQRSRIAQEWISKSCHDRPRIRGGYKAFRNYLITQLENMQQRFVPLLLGGYTGSGKTLLLHKILHKIDLEELANHRGSAFGQHIQPQPTQISFENALAFDLIQKLDKGFSHLIFEDEGKNVGSNYLPKKFFYTIANADLILLETPLYERIEITWNEYVLQAQKEYRNIYGMMGIEEWAENIRRNIDRIQRRLGMQRHNKIRTLFDIAYEYQKKTDIATNHKHWIALLLKEYYDPMYDYQLQKKENKIIFKGNSKEVLAYQKSILYTSL